MAVSDPCAMHERVMMHAMARIFMVSLGRLKQSRIILFLNLGIEILSQGSADIDRIDCNLYCQP